MCFRPPQVNKPQKCPECNAYNQPNAKICKKCGAELDMVTCPECGAKQPAANSVCGNCGFNGKPGSGNPDMRKQD